MELAAAAAPVSPGAARSVKESAVILLWSASLLMLFAAGFFAQAAATTSDPERWLVTIISSAVNLMAAFITYLTAREIRLNDSEKKIAKADLERALKDNQECKEDRAKLHKKSESQDRKILKLMQRVGMIPEDDDDETNAEVPDRRGETGPPYRGPRRRKDDPPPVDKPA